MEVRVYPADRQQFLIKESQGGNLRKEHGTEAMEERGFALLSFFSYTVQPRLPKEWCHPKWSRPSYIN